MSLITARHACTTAKPCRPDEGRIDCWIGLLPASAAYGGEGHQVEAVANRQQPGSDVTGLGICKPASWRDGKPAQRPSKECPARNNTQVLATKRAS